MVKVSICVPVYGVEKSIERCATSLFEQTYENIEYVFVNDFTKDRSIEILERIIDRFPHRKSNVLIINHVRNKGLAEARNTAIYNATGDFIIHVDSDDYIEKEATEFLVKRQCETNADVVNMGYFTHIGGKIKCTNPYEYNLRQDLICDTIRRRASFVIWGRLIRRTLYIKHNVKSIGGLNMGEDWQTIPRILYYAKSIASLNFYGYHYIIHGNTYTSSFTIEKGRQIFGCYKVLEEFFSNKGIQYVDALKDGHAEIVGELLQGCYKTNYFDDFFSFLEKEKKKIDKERYKNTYLKIRPFLYFSNKIFLKCYINLCELLKKISHVRIR